MNKNLMALTYRNLMDTLAASSVSTIPPEKMLRVMMLSLADMCSAIAFDTEDERQAVEDKMFEK